MTVKKKRVDTVVLGSILPKLKAPPFQREIKVNKKLLDIAEEVKQTGVFPGILTIGILNGDLYILDGQHRIEACRVSECPEILADVHYIECESMAEMGEEFVRLNSSIVRFGPDDILRALEKSTPNIAFIRTQCPFVGYSSIRRNEHSPIVSMSRLLRAWHASGPEVPAGGGPPAAQLAEQLTRESAEDLVRFCQIALVAWGREAAYARLWNHLNLALCMWLYRRTVLLQSTIKKSRLTADLFRKGMMALSADSDYMDWLVGRMLTDRDRSPAYDRLKGVVQRRLAKELGAKPMLPQPAWAAHNKSGLKKSAA